MKALSIKQPWAWLICAGYKDIENRSWLFSILPYWANREMKPIRIYVHTGSSKADMTKEALAWILNRLSNRQSAQLMLAYNQLAFGSIIGEVDVTGCVKESDSPWFVGPYGFVLANPTLYKEPIPCRGRLGFFNPEVTP